MLSYYCGEYLASFCPPPHPVITFHANCGLVFDTPTVPPFGITRCIAYNELKTKVEQWSMQTITEKSKDIKRTDTSDDSSGEYCVIEIRRSPSTSRLFTISHLIITLFLFGVNG